MGLTSLQVCMDTSEWLQGTIQEDGGMDSSPSSGDIVTCSRPLLERRLRPPHDLSLKCPRCDSAHTKFCYYNNYSLSQPRYFCKTCRRYWTKGGSLRNIPVGGGCRKNKRLASKKSTPSSSNEQVPISSHTNNDTTTTDLHLSFPHEAPVQMPPHFISLFGNGEFEGLNLMESKYNGVHDHQVADFLESNSSKYEHNLIIGNPTNHDFMGNYQSGFHGNISLNGSNNLQHDSLMMNTQQRLMLPFDEADEVPNHAFEMKPNKQQLEHHHQWSHQQQVGHEHDQNAGCSEGGKDLFGGYFSGNGIGSWSGLMNGYGYGSSHQTNPLV